MYTGIISAMKEEIQAVLEVLEIESKQVKGMRTYYIGSLYDKPVVLVFSRWGKVASATTATQLINDFKIDQIIFTGVAGAISKDLQIGDIIVGRKLFQHDMNASPLVKTYEVPLLGKSSFITDTSKRSALLLACKNFLNEKETFLSKTLLEEFNIKSPKVIESDIASGDQFISSKSQCDKISEGLPTVKCVEMEGAAVAQVCFEYNKPFSIVRTISDNANNNAHIDFPKFAREIASNYALGILKSYLSSI